MIKILLILCLLNSLSIAQVDEKEWIEYIEVTNEQIINTENSEFSPTFWNNHIVYIKSNPRQKNVDKETNQPYFDLFFTQKNKGYLSKATNLSKVINTPYHEGPASFPSNGKNIFFTRVDFDGSEFTTTKNKVAALKIFESTYQNGSWAKAIKSNLNLDEIASCHPAINNENTVIIFASDRPGGYGKMDLYMSKEANGKWSTPINLGPTINSSGNEWFPYINENNYLYFASDSNSSSNDLDIYQCQNIDSLYTNPIRLPYPINTRYDDFGICINKTGNSGYFSSNRPGGKGGDDIYNINALRTLYSYGDENYNKIFLNVSDYKNEKPLSNALIRFQRLENQEVQSFNENIFSLDPLAKTDSTYTNKSGSANIQIEEGFTLIEVSYPTKQPWFQIVSNHHLEKNINIILEDTITITEVEPKIVYVEKEVPKQETINNVIVTKGSTIVLDNIYYDYNSYELTAGAKKELEALVKIMLANTNLKIELSAHTDSRGKKDYNKLLSQKRADSAKAHLLAQGVQLSNIIAIGHGETKPRNHCKDDVRCSEAEHIYNRRVEVKIIEK